MNTSNKIINKPAKDPIEKLIYEHGLRINQILPVKKQDSLIIFLNNGNTIAIKLSSFIRLKKATQKILDQWNLISKGIGIEWPTLDEDISLKGLIQQLIIQNTLKFIAGGNVLGIAA